MAKLFGFGPRPNSSNASSARERDKNRRTKSEKDDSSRDQSGQRDRDGKGRNRKEKKATTKESRRHDALAADSSSSGYESETVETSLPQPPPLPTPSPSLPTSPAPAPAPTSAMSADRAIWLEFCRKNDLVPGDEFTGVTGRQRTITASPHYGTHRGGGGGMRPYASFDAPVRIGGKDWDARLSLHPRTVDGRHRPSHGVAESQTALPYMWDFGKEALHQPMGGGLGETMKTETTPPARSQQELHFGPGRHVSFEPGAKVHRTLRYRRRAHHSGGGGGGGGGGAGAGRDHDYSDDNQMAAGVAESAARQGQEAETSAEPGKKKMKSKSLLSHAVGAYTAHNMDTANGVNSTERRKKDRKNQKKKKKQAEKATKYSGSGPDSDDDLEGIYNDDNQAHFFATLKHSAALAGELRAAVSSSSTTTAGSSSSSHSSPRTRKQQDRDRKKAQDCRRQLRQALDDLGLLDMEFDPRLLAEDGEENEKGGMDGYGNGKGTNPNSDVLLTRLVALLKADL
ncbi:hypothetical protein GGR56DRAFT_662234 [Xylariaceae sp. FL0804]|nr:hypothetical protein GGR56DRAFT_662234 [Xylariaceae sp. FL0804]